MHPKIITVSPSKYSFCQSQKHLSALSSSSMPALTTGLGPTGLPQTLFLWSREPQQTFLSCLFIFTVDQSQAAHLHVCFQVSSTLDRLPKHKCFWVSPRFFSERKSKPGLCPSIYLRVLRELPGGNDLDPATWDMRGSGFYSYLPSYNHCMFSVWFGFFPSLPFSFPDLKTLPLPVSQPHWTTVICWGDNEITWVKQKHREYKTSVNYALGHV